MSSLGFNNSNMRSRPNSFQKNKSSFNQRPNSDKKNVGSKSVSLNTIKINTSPQATDSKKSEDLTFSLQKYLSFKKEKSKTNEIKTKDETKTKSTKSISAKHSFRKRMRVSDIVSRSRVPKKYSFQSLIV